jgi:hypothetical protein
MKSRPYRWLHKDPEIHKKYRPYLSHKTQCQFHQQQWDLTFEEWLTFWTPEQWLCRGRAGDNLCMRRIDLNQSWNKTNVELVSRRLMVKLAHERRVKLCEEKNIDVASNFDQERSTVNQ